VIAWLLTAWAAPPAELVWVEVGDGHHLALHHKPNPGRPPVVLCHGISSNHRFWDLEPGRSLADALWDAGFDVWNMDLRGHGDAERHPDGARQKGGWTVDDYGRVDLPAAFARVTAATGAERVSYVGHSMGGMVLAVYLATHPEPAVARAVVVGSPLDFRDPDPVVEALFGAAPVGEALGRVPTPAGARVVAVTGRDTLLKFDEIVHNPANIDRKAEARMLREVVSPLYRGEIEQFSLVRLDGEFHSADGAIVYRQALRDVDVPMLFVAGRADRVVSPDRVWSYYEAVGSDEKSFVMASVANGMHGDYGHLDLGCGDHAKDDIFPLIVGWLQ
jgi:pimeloyl-ACP methyl ester carboxylesterase